MEPWRNFRNIAVACLLLLGGRFCAPGFSLLGPYADWMTVTNGYKLPRDIGGPVEIGQGYRWNVPVVTYGFDNSFLDYFGSNGVKAVESAIQVLNHLPPASALVLTNFVLDARLYDSSPQAPNLFDLKTTALTVLLAELGLGSPLRNVYDAVSYDPVFRTASTDQDWPPGTIPNHVIMRDYDPQALTLTDIVNGVLYGAEVYYDGYMMDVVEYPIDNSNPSFTAVADLQYVLDAGEYVKQLTQDDAGGIRYLYGTNTIQLEPLLFGIRGRGLNATNYVSTAMRPGVDKVTFSPHPRDAVSGQFVPFTNQFVDTYITNGGLSTQELERVISEPDFLFSATDTSLAANSLPAYSPPLYVGSTANSWSNNAVLNGHSSPTNGGPGIIVPPINIAFHKMGPEIDTRERPDSLWGTYQLHFGSFDNAGQPTVYPTATAQDNTSLTVRISLFPNIFFSPGEKPNLRGIWHLPVPYGSQASVQISTNLVDWVSLGTITNTGGIVEWNHFGTLHAQAFFRSVPQ